MIINPFIFAVAGGGGGFTPASLANCELYLEADSISQADNTDVTLWPDLSGHGRDATGVPIIGYPKFRTNVVNSLPVIELGASGFPTFNLPDFMTGFASAEVFWLYKQASSGTNLVIHNWSNHGTTNHIPFSDGNFYEGFASTTRRGPVAALISPSSAYRLYNVVSANGGYEMRQNNASMFSSGTNTVGWNSAPTIRSDSGQGNIRILAVVLYSGAAKNSTDRDSLIAFWEAKYALTLH